MFWNLVNPGYGPIALNEGVGGVPKLDFWGDSLTAGTGAASAAGYYPQQVSDLYTTPRTFYNGGVGGDTSTQIKARLLAASAADLAATTIIWAGRNNFASGATVLADIAAMVAALGHTRYLVLSVLNTSAEANPSVGYTQITDINASLSSTYGIRYVDVRSLLVAQGAPAGGYPDATAYAGDYPPSGLINSGAPHMNNAGYGIVAGAVFAALPAIEGRNYEPDQGYQTEASALFARMVSPPSAARKQLINTFIKAMKDASIWNDHDFLHVMAAADIQAARLNWKSTSFTASAVSSPTFTADRGFTGDGAASYVDTNYTPSTAGGNATLNSGCFSIHILNNVVAAGVTGINDGTNFTGINPRNGSSQRIGRVNQGASTTGAASTDSRGLTSINRSGPGAIQLSVDGVQVATGSIASTALPTASLRYGSGGAGVFNTMQHAIGRMASSQDGTKELAFYNAARAYLQGVGAI